MTNTSNKQPIPNFRLDDSTIYHWNIVRNELDRNSAWQNKVQHFMVTYLKWMASTLIPAILIYSAFRCLEMASLSMAFWAAGVGTGLGLLLTVSGVIVSVSTVFFHRQAKARIISVVAAITSLGGAFYLLSAPESSLAEGFLGAEGAGLWAWMLFFFDNVLSALFFDIPELVFGYRFSAITGDSPSSRAVVVLIRVLIVIGVVQVLMSLLRGRQKSQSTQQFFSTVPGCIWYCPDSFDQRQEPLECLGKVAPFPDPIDLSLEEFVTDCREAWERAQLKTPEIHEVVAFVPPQIAIQLDAAGAKGHGNGG